MTTQAHSTQIAPATLPPLGDGVPAASQPAASRLSMVWNSTITMTLMMIKASLTANMPSRRYENGFVNHSVEPERNCTKKATQMNGTRLRSAVNGIFGNKPNSRKAMMVMNPRFVAVPYACNVSAPAQPQDC